jgi:hypothetical protein
VLLRCELASIFEQVRAARPVASRKLRKLSSLNSAPKGRASGIGVPPDELISRAI